MKGKKETGARSRIINIIAIVLFLILAGFCIKGIYNVLKWKDTTGDYLSSVEQLKATDDNLMDVVFCGSSHCYCGIMPPVFWEDMGISAFDMAISGQDKDSTYYHLKNLLKTQSPKVVFIDLYGMVFDEHGVEGNVYRNLLSMPFSLNSVKLVMDYADKDKWEDYIARFPVVHTRYRELTKYDFLPYEPNAYGRGEAVGFWTAPGTPEPWYMTDELQPAELTEKNKLWLERLTELAEKENFELVFISLPFTGDEEQQHLIDSGLYYAEERGYATIDFNRLRNEIGLDYDTDFIDSAHVNQKGAEKLAAYLEAFMAERYDLADHRGDSKYWQWDKDLEWYNNLKLENDIKATGELDKLVSLIAGDENMLAIISLEGTYVQDERPYFDGLSGFGMEYSDYEKPGKWIYENGKLERVFYDDLGAEPYERELSSTDTLRIKYEGDYNFQENVMINKQPYHNKGAYLCITVYNKMLNRVVDSRSY